MDSIAPVPSRADADAGRASHPEHRRRRLGWAAAVAALVALSTTFVVEGVRAQPRAHTSRNNLDYGTAPNYRLVDQNGRTVSSKVFRGEVQVVTYLFPYCTSYCPLLAREMAVLQHRIDTGVFAGKVQLVSFNVDPQGAGPPQLRRFMTQYGGNPSSGSWQFLTGSLAQVRQVVNGGYHVFFERTSLAAENHEIAQEKAAGTFSPQPRQPNALAARAHVSYDIVHNDYVEIVNPSGQIVALFDQASTLTDAQLLSAVTRAIAGQPIPPPPAG